MVAGRGVAEVVAKGWWNRGVPLPNGAGLTDRVAVLEFRPVDVSAIPPAPEVSLFSGVLQTVRAQLGYYVAHSTAQTGKS